MVGRGPVKDINNSGEKIRQHNLQHLLLFQPFGPKVQEFKNGGSLPPSTFFNPSLDGPKAKRKERQNG